MCLVLRQWNSKIRDTLRRSRHITVYFKPSIFAERIFNLRILRSKLNDNEGFIWWVQISIIILKGPKTHQFNTIILSVQQTPHFNTKNPQFNRTLIKTPKKTVLNWGLRWSNGFLMWNWGFLVLNWGILGAEKVWSLCWTEG